MRHEIKIGMDFADAIVRGEKSFELRRNDRGYQKGDEIAFRVVDREGNLMPYHTLNQELFVIEYVLSGWGLREGFVAFSIKKTIPF